MILARIKGTWYRSERNRQRDGTLMDDRRLRAIMEFSDIFINTEGRRSVLKDRTGAYTDAQAAVLQMKLFVEGKTFKDLPKIAYGRDVRKLRMWLDREVHGRN